MHGEIRFNNATTQEKRVKLTGKCPLFMRV